MASRIGSATLMACCLSALTALAAICAGCEDPSVRFNQAGLAAYRAGDYAKARAGFEEAIHHNPDVGAYYFNRAMAEQALGNLTQAIFSYEMAVKLSPGIVQAYQNAATCHLALNQPEKARQILEQGAQANPFTGEAFINLGKFYASRGDTYNAKLALAKGVAADPDNAAVHREYAQLLLQLGERDKGIEHLRRSLELSPIQPDVSAKLSELAPSGDQLPPPKPQTE